MIGRCERMRLGREYAADGRAMDMALRARARRRGARRAPDRRCGTCRHAEGLTAEFAGVSADVNGAVGCPIHGGLVSLATSCDAWETA